MCIIEAIMYSAVFQTHDTYLYVVSKKIKKYVRLFDFCFRSNNPMFYLTNQGR